jgi:hypothetical protein
LARVTGCRFQKLRKKAGVTPQDPVEFFYELTPPPSLAAAATAAQAAAVPASSSSGGPLANGHHQQGGKSDSSSKAAANGTPDPLAALVSEHGAYLRESLGAHILPASCRPPSAVILATEK